MSLLSAFRTMDRDAADWRALAEIRAELEANLAHRAQGRDKRQQAARKGAQTKRRQAREVRV